MATGDPHPHVVFTELELGEDRDVTVRKPFCSRGRIMVITVASILITFVCAISALTVSIILTSSALQGVQASEVIATLPVPSTPLTTATDIQDQFAPTPSLSGLDPGLMTFTSTSLAFVVTASQGRELPGTASPVVRPTGGATNPEDAGGTLYPSTAATEQSAGWAGAESGTVQLSVVTLDGMVSTGTVEAVATTVQVEMTATATVTGSTETPPPEMPACQQHQHRCASGQCVEGGVRCDGTPHCLDLSDEMRCPDCPGFQCLSSALCLPHPSLRCDGIFHCPDLSDEVNCTRRFGFRFCANGVQVADSLWCNRVDDCGDNSDETNCSCGGRFACGPGDCVLYDWRCDGHPDCPDASDEANCNQCGEGKFACLRSRCLDKSGRCDGTPQCSLQEDEAHCFHQDLNTSKPQPLRVTLRGSNYSVCTDDWTPVLSEVVCHALGHRRGGHHQVAQGEGEGVVALDSGVATPLTSMSELTQRLTPRSSCSSGHVIQVLCQAADCGQRLSSVAVRRVAGGDIVGEGKWPWVVSLSFLGRPVCGGVLLSSQWVLTAAHCMLRPVASPLRPSDLPYFFQVQLGSVQRSSGGVCLQASGILVHPSMSGEDSLAFSQDLALVRLSAPVELSPRVQPICLPPPPSARPPPLSQHCYVVGWGQVSSHQEATVERLREARLRLWEDQACAGDAVLGEGSIHTSTTLCAGLLPLGLPSACQGDSGSPLMCQTAVGGWGVVGVMSKGSPYCGGLSPNTRANRFARVDTALNWIQQVLAGG